MTGPPFRRRPPRRAGRRRSTAGRSLAASAGAVRVRDERAARGGPGRHRRRARVRAHPQGPRARAPARRRARLQAGVPRTTRGASSRRYRRILAPAGARPACLAASRDDDGGRCWLLIDKVAGVELWQIGELRGVGGGRAVARAHARCASRGAAELRRERQPAPARPLRRPGSCAGPTGRASALARVPDRRAAGARRRARRPTTSSRAGSRRRRGRSSTASCTRRTCSSWSRARTSRCSPSTGRWRRSGLPRSTSRRSSAGWAPAERRALEDAYRGEMGAGPHDQTALDGQLLRSPPAPRAAVARVGGGLATAARARARLARDGAGAGAGAGPAVSGARPDRQRRRLRSLARRQRRRRALPRAGDRDQRDADGPLARRGGRGGSTRGARRRSASGLHVDLGEWVYRDGEWHAALRGPRRGDAGDGARGAGAPARALRAARRAPARPPGLPPARPPRRARPERGAGGRRAASACRSAARAGFPYGGGFFGQGHHGASRCPSWSASTRSSRRSRRCPTGITEFGCHPATAVDHDTTYAEQRLIEVRTLCDPRVRAAVERRGATLATYPEAAGMPAG